MYVHKSKEVIARSQLVGSRGAHRRGGKLHTDMVLCAGLKQALDLFYHPAASCRQRRNLGHSLTAIPLHTYV